MPLSIQEKPNGLVFKIRVQPRSSKNKIVGLYGDALKVMLTAPPVNDAANKSCKVLISKLLGIAKSSVTIQSGHAGRNKQILIQCVDGSAERRTILKAIQAWERL